MAHEETAKLLDGVDRTKLEEALHEIVISNFRMRGEVPGRGLMSFFRGNGYAAQKPEDWMDRQFESMDLRTDPGFVNTTTSMITDFNPYHLNYEERHRFMQTAFRADRTDARSLTAGCNPKDLGEAYVKHNLTAGEMIFAAGAAAIGLAALDRFATKGRGVRTIRNLARRAFTTAGALVNTAAGYIPLRGQDALPLQTFRAHGVTQAAAALERARGTQEELLAPQARADAAFTRALQAQEATQTQARTPQTQGGITIPQARGLARATAALERAAKTENEIRNPGLKPGRRVGTP